MREVKPAAAVAEPALAALAEAARLAGDDVTETASYAGNCEVLLLWGIGAPMNDAARRRHLAAGGRVVHIDLGYFGSDRHKWFRLCIDHDHPHSMLEATHSDMGRWAAHGIRLRSEMNPAGPVILVGLGKKSRAYLQLPDWEREKFAELKQRFKSQRIIFRPKKQGPVLGVRTDATTPIAKLLRGAALVVCRHSNVAVDAAKAGVPFECEEGAALWLQRRDYTVSNRLDFLRRLACWQYRPDEATKAWAFAKGIMQCA